MHILVNEQYLYPSALKSAVSDRSLEDQCRAGMENNDRGRGRNQDNITKQA